MKKDRNICLSKKTAIVTGGLGILGQHFCSGLAESGAQVVVVDINAEECSRFAAELTKMYDTTCLGIACDISVPSEVDALVKTIEQKIGDIHILHNNAATKASIDEFFKPFEEFSLQTWQDVMRVNVDGMFLMAQAVGKHMITRKIHGSIIQTASLYGVVAPDQRIYEGSEYMGVQINTPAVYSASKAAVIGLTKFLASYWGHKGIRVNTISPGGIKSGQNDTFRKQYSQRVPLGRMGEASELVGALVFLASDASSYITGQNIIVDGGVTAW